MHVYTIIHGDEGNYSFCVGYWSPAAYGEPVKWVPLRDFEEENRAAAWVSYLNGGSHPDAANRKD
jgi:hypothetical protein